MEIPWIGIHLLVLCMCIAGNLSEKLPVPSEHVDINEFLDTHATYNRYTVTKKETSFTSLAYVTPWNTRGFEVAKIFAAKFDLISPVWFQVLGRKKSYTVAGVPNINKEWVKSLKTVNPNVKIVPRFIFDDWQLEDFAETFGDVSQMDICIAKLMKMAKQFDGAVVELWSQFFGSSEHNLVEFVQRLGQKLREEKLLMVLVIPPPVYSGDHPGRFSARHFEQLFNNVDYFSLMTYDYSPPSNPGPNSPIRWIKKCVSSLVPEGSKDQVEKRSQLLTGFNFYGLHHIPERRFGDHVLGHQFVEFVNTTRADFIWDAENAEHHLEFQDDENLKHYVHYPTLMSIARRLSLAHELGTGISIWEIGQGLDSFYSLL